MGLYERRRARVEHDVTNGAFETRRAAESIFEHITADGEDAPPALEREAETRCAALPASVGAWIVEIAYSSEADARALEAELLDMGLAPRVVTR